MPKHAKLPPTLDDAALMALDEALSEAGYAPVADQPVACDDLEDALLDALWNNDMTLQEAARSAVRRCGKRLVREAVIEWGGRGVA